MADAAAAMCLLLAVAGGEGAHPDPPPGEGLLGVGHHLEISPAGPQVRDQGDSRSGLHQGGLKSAVRCPSSTAFDHLDTRF